MMFEDLQRRVKEMQGMAGVRTVFGEVLDVDGRKVIPVASVRYAFGMGGGRAAKREEDGSPGGGGGGGAVRIEPLALIELEEGRVKMTPIVNVTRLALMGMLLVAWNVFWITRTIRVTSRSRGTA